MNRIPEMEVRCLLSPTQLYPVSPNKLKRQKVASLKSENNRRKYSSQIIPNYNQTYPFPPLSFLPCTCITLTPVSWVYCIQHSSTESLFYA